MKGFSAYEKVLLVKFAISSGWQSRCLWAKKMRGTYEHHALDGNPGWFAD